MVKNQEPKNKHLHIRVTETFQNNLKDAAGKDVTNYVTNAVEEKIKRDGKKCP